MDAVDEAPLMDEQSESSEDKFKKKINQSMNRVDYLVFKGA